MINSGIYKIENVLNNKVYIGLSVDIKKRWSTHKRKLYANKHSNKHLQSAWNKYGGTAFTFEVIELCEDQLLSNKEIYWADYYRSTLNKTLYNIAACGGRPPVHKGTEHYLYDTTMYTFYNKDGRIERDITQFDMVRKHNLDQRNISKVLKNQCTISGWRVTEEDNICRYTFYHLDGREEVNISQIEMVNKHNLNKVSALVLGRRLQHKGWFFSLVELDKHKLKNIRNVTSPDGKQFILIDKQEFKKLTDFSLSTINRVFSRGNTVYKGWSLKT